MKNFFKALALFFLAGCSRQPIDFNFTDFHWHIKFDEQSTGVTEKWFQQAPQETQVLPKLTNINDIYGSEYIGDVWYFSEFTLKKFPAKTAIEFENIDDEGEFWINGQKVGSHQGANILVKKDVSKLLHKGTNSISIRIKNTGGPGGLLKGVRLIAFQQPEDLLKGKWADAATAPLPEWAKNAIIYEVNIRQFTKEGTFQAFEAHLPRLKKLGVDLLWFMPIHPIGEENRKGTLGSPYAVKDYYGINPNYGTLQDFRALVDKAHEMDMHVLIDLVANHTAWDNPLTKTHPEWFTKDENGAIIHPIADWYDTADLNYDVPELRRYMTDMLKYWITDIGIDGYRCDVAEMVPMDFWQDAIAELRTIKPIFMLAEGESAELHANGFNMSYASKMYWTFNDIASGKRSAAALDSLLQLEHRQYPTGALRMRFTSNHDENSWNGTVYERLGEKASLAFAALTFTLPGKPLIYTGMETGIDKRIEFFEKDPVEWQTGREAFYSTLANLYKHHPALYNGTMHNIISTNENIFAFSRTAGQDEILVICNLSQDNIDFELDLKVDGHFKEIFKETTLSLKAGTVNMSLKPWAYRIYVKEK